VQHPFIIKKINKRISRTDFQKKRLCLTLFNYLVNNPLEQ